MRMKNIIDCSYWELSQSLSASANASANASASESNYSQWSEVCNAGCIKSGKKELNKYIFTCSSEMSSSLITTICFRDYAWSQTSAVKRYFWFISSVIV